MRGRGLRTDHHRGWGDGCETSALGDGLPGGAVVGGLDVVVLAVGGLPVQPDADGTPGCCRGRPEANGRWSRRSTSECRRFRRSRRSTSGQGRRCSCSRRHSGHTFRAQASKLFSIRPWTWSSVQSALEGSTHGWHGAQQVRVLRREILVTTEDVRLSVREDSVVSSPAALAATAAPGIGPLAERERVRRVQQDPACGQLFLVLGSSFAGYMPWWRGS